MTCLTQTAVPQLQLSANASKDTTHLLREKNRTPFSINKKKKKSHRQLAPHQNNITSDKYHLTKWKCIAGPKLTHFLEWHRIHSRVARWRKSRERECMLTTWLSHGYQTEPGLGKSPRTRQKTILPEKHTETHNTTTSFMPWKRKHRGILWFFTSTLTTFLQKRLSFPSTQS